MNIRSLTTLFVISPPPLSCNKPIHTALLTSLSFSPSQFASHPIYFENPPEHPFAKKVAISFRTTATPNQPYQKIPSHINIATHHQPGNYSTVHFSPGGPLTTLRPLAKIQHPYNTSCANCTLRLFRSSKEKKLG